MVTRCKCGNLIRQQPVGRPRKWCSDGCRRKYGSSEPKVELDPADVEELTPVVIEFLEHHRFRSSDARLIAGLILKRLAQASDQDPASISLAREMRSLLSFIEAAGAVVDDGAVDEERVAFLRRRLEMIGRRDG